MINSLESYSCILEPGTFYQMAGIVSDGWGNCIFLSCKGEQIMVADEHGTPMCIAEVKVCYKYSFVWLGLRPSMDRGSQLTCSGNDGRAIQKCDQTAS